MINFFNEDISFSFRGKRARSKWIKEVIATNSPQKRIGDINIVFCSDDYMLNANNQFLKHNYYTDIITFDYTQLDTISGDLLISIDTVKSNAIEYNSTFDLELHRVIIHGILHLLGFNDSTHKESLLMRKAEDKALFASGFFDKI